MLELQEECASSSQLQPLFLSFVMLSFGGSDVEMLVITDGGFFAFQAPTDGAHSTAT
jgi:hypothetical protein